MAMANTKLHNSDHNEASPLLESSQPTQHRRPVGHRRTTSLASLHIPKAHRKRTILNLLLFGAFLASASSGFFSIPQTRLIEDALCHTYYGQRGGAPISEDECKVETVQSELAFVIAISSALDAAVSFVAAFPWSLAADRVGRQPILAIALSGMVLSNIWSLLVLWFRATFSVRLVWFGSLSYLFGGGNPVAVGLLLSMVADATTDEERAVIYMRVHMSSTAGNLIAPTISSFMMARIGPWPPALIGCSLITLSILVIAFLPETLNKKTLGDETEPPEQQPTTLRARFSSTVARFKESASMLRSPSLVLLLLTCLGTMPLALSTMSFMAVFLSKRYGIQMYQSGYVQTAYGVAQMVVSLLFLPWLSHYLLQPTTTSRLRQPNDKHRDLSIVRWSAVIGLVAVLILGLAPTLSGFVFGLAILAMSSGTVSILRSLLSLYVDPVHRSRLYGLVGMVEIVGAIYAQPMLAGLFALGMKIGGEGLGMPYFGLAALMGVVAVLLWFVRVPGGIVSPVDGEQEQ